MLTCPTCAHSLSDLPAPSESGLNCPSCDTPLPPLGAQGQRHPLSVIEQALQQKQALVLAQSHEVKAHLLELKSVVAHVKKAKVPASAPRLQGLKRAMGYLQAQLDANQRLSARYQLSLEAVARELDRLALQHHLPTEALSLIEAHLSELKAMEQANEALLLQAKAKAELAALLNPS